MFNTHWVTEWTIKHIEAAFQAEDNLLDLSKGWEAEESCLPQAPVTAWYPFRRRLNSSRSNGSEMVKLEPSFSYPQQNISYKSVDRNYLTDLSPHWFQISIRSLHYRLWTVPWPVQCLLVGSISPSAIVTEMPNIRQTLSREIVLSGWRYSLSKNLTSDSLWRRLPAQVFLPSFYPKNWAPFPAFGGFSPQMSKGRTGPFY